LRAIHQSVLNVPVDCLTAFCAVTKFAVSGWPAKAAAMEVT
jgi:hypothetical protein